VGAFSESAAIDRWIEPRLEQVYTCRKCGHEPETHDEYGCYAPLIYGEYLEPRQDDTVFCDCKGFE